MSNDVSRFKRGRALAVLCAMVAVMVWFAPLSDLPATGKGRALAQMLDLVLVPLIGLAGKGGGMIALGVVAVLGLAQGLGVRLPPLLSPRAASAPEHPHQEGFAPTGRRHGLGAAPPDEATRKPRTVALENQMRTAVGDDFTLTDDIADRAIDLAAEWERRGTPHGEHVDPVALIRKPRDKDRDWSDDRSWLGGLPRLGGQDWPRGKDGKPLPFIAQLDLAEIAAANPDTPLPKAGSLAFFINDGAVLFVPPGDHQPTFPPEDLPHAFEECGYPLPDTPSPLTHPLFAFWPLEAVRMAMPDDLPPMDKDNAYYAQVEAAQTQAMAAIAPRSRHSFSIGDQQTSALDGADTTFWYAAKLVLRQLQAAHGSLARTIASREKSLADAAAYRAQLLAAQSADEQAMAQSQTFEDRLRASIAAVGGEAEGLATLIEHFAAFVSRRDSWAEMTAEEVDVLKEVIATARRDFPELCRYAVSRDIRDLRDASLRRMITGDRRAATAIPDAVLAQINAHHRLPTDWQHQMFGVGGCRQDALYDHLCDHLLLQIVYDALPELRLGDMGLYQFWINPAALAQGRWDKAELTFECA